MQHVQTAHRRHLSSCPIPLPHATLPFGTHLMHGTSVVVNLSGSCNTLPSGMQGFCCITWSIRHHVLQKCLPAVTCSVALPPLLPLHADRLCWTRSDPKNGVRLSGKQ